MIFTVGHTESYERYFREQIYWDGTGPTKLGRTGDYPGGSVWKTFEEAKSHCPTNYSVYGVEADWDRDTVLLKDDDSGRSLLVTSPIVRLAKEQANVSCPICQG